MANTGEREKNYEKMLLEWKNSGFRKLSKDELSLKKGSFCWILETCPQLATDEYKAKIQEKKEQWCKDEQEESKNWWREHAKTKNRSKEVALDLNIKYDAESLDEFVEPLFEAHTSLRKETEELIHEKNGKARLQCV